MIKLFLFAILILGLTTAELNQNTLEARTSDISFLVSNQQPINVGTVTVSTSQNDYYVPAPNQTDYYVLISEQAVSVTVAGTVVNSGNQAVVSLPGGAQVGVRWTSTSAIAIVDKDEIF